MNFEIETNILPGRWFQFSLIFFLAGRLKNT